MEELKALREWMQSAPDLDIARIEEMEIAVAQAVEFAEYVEGAAKGAMVERAQHFLSLPYARRLAERLHMTANDQVQPDRHDGGTDSTAPRSGLGLNELLGREPITVRNDMETKPIHLSDRLRESIQPGDYLTSNVPNRLVYEAARMAALFDVAMTTLQQIESTPRNAGARRNARATLRFIETQQAV